MKITPTSLTVNQLFGSTNEQYLIPTYQRRYSWHERQIVELIDDINLIEDDDTHLLGSIVCLAGHHKAGLNQLEVVDGQQRLTTVSILLECIRQRFEKDGLHDEAGDLAQLLYARPLGGTQARKVLLDSIDSEEYTRLLNSESDGDYKNASLQSAFRIIREQVAEAKIEGLRIFLYRLRNHSVVIRLDVANAKDAFKLFETINNRGLKLSPTDIIKNFLLGNAARFGVESLELARKSWTLLLLHLDDTSSDAFFRYYLMSVTQLRVTKAEVVGKFKSVVMTRVTEASLLPERNNYLDEDDDQDEEDGVLLAAAEEPLTDQANKMSFKEFLDGLSKFAKIYGDLVRAQTGDKRIDRHLRGLRMIKAVQTYGFLMHLRAGACGDKEFRDILKLTEAFVLRRHVCRERSNDTEALFARLCGINPTHPMAETKAAYRELCPSDATFKEAFASASFSANLVERARYCLERIESARHGDHEEIQVLGADDVHVEHIMPQKIRTKKVKEEFGDWVTYLGNSAESLHPKFVDRIGNLTLFAGALNIGASNNPFARKKSAYKQSAVIMTRDLAQMSSFKFSNIEARSKVLADAAVGLWPMP